MSEVTQAAQLSSTGGEKHSAQLVLYTTVVNGMIGAYSQSTMMIRQRYSIRGQFLDY